MEKPARPANLHSKANGKSSEPVALYYERVRGSLVRLNDQFSYHVGADSLNEEDLREYITEPIAALPPQVSPLLPPKIVLLLVPYLDRAKNGNGHSHAAKEFVTPAEVYVAFSEPGEGRWAPYISIRKDDTVIVALGVEAQETADYHYHLFHELAHLAAENLTPERITEYTELLSEELRTGAHGEVDDESWTMKQSVGRVAKRKPNGKPGADGQPSKAMVNYAHASFVDTLTLYLHGICCDIDVEPGPRQLPSRHLRKRLKLLQQMLPAPKGYAVFPEELDELSRE